MIKLLYCLFFTIILYFSLFLFTDFNPDASNISLHPISKYFTVEKKILSIKRVLKDGPDFDYKNRVSYFSISNLGPTILESPFLYSSQRFNIRNFSVLKHQIDEVAKSQEEQMILAWSALTKHHEANCAAGTVGYFPVRGIELVNSYGYYCCDQAAHSFLGLSNLLGVRGRQITLRKPGHSVSEVFYNDKWHLYDTNLRTLYFGNDKGIASFEAVHSGEVDRKKSFGNITFDRGFGETQYESQYPRDIYLESKYLAFRLFPGEQIRYIKEDEALSPSRVLPWNNQLQKPRHVSRAIKTIVLRSIDPRISRTKSGFKIGLEEDLLLQGGWLDLYFLSGNHKLLNGYFEVSDGLKSFQVRMNEISCNKSNDNFCHIKLNLSFLIKEVANKTLSQLKNGEFVFRKTPRFWINIESNAKPSMRFVSGLGELQIQVSSFIFPLKGVDYEYRDLGRGCGRRAQVQIENKVFEKNFRFYEFPCQYFSKK